MEDHKKVGDSRLLYSLPKFPFLALAYFSLPSPNTSNSSQRGKQCASNGFAVPFRMLCSNASWIASNVCDTACVVLSVSGRGLPLWPVLLSGARLMLGGIREQEENRLQIIKADRMRLAARFILFLTPIPSSMYSSPCIFRFPKAHIACLYKLYRIRRTDVC